MKEKKKLWREEEDEGEEEVVVSLSLLIGVGRSSSLVRTHAALHFTIRFR